MRRRPVAVGRPAAAVTGAAAADVAEVEGDGNTAALVTVDGAPAGVLGFTDRARDGTAAAVGDLADLTGRIPVLLTGDNSQAADALARNLGIAEVHAGLLPADKVDRVRRLEDSGARVLVVGLAKLVHAIPAMVNGHRCRFVGNSGGEDAGAAPASRVYQAPGLQQGKRSLGR